MTGVSPLTIWMMLAIHVSPEPWHHVGMATWKSEAGRDVLRWLFENQLIDDETDPEATEKGRKWVEYICKTPLPVQSWHFPARVMDNAVQPAPLGQ